MKFLGVAIIILGAVMLVWTGFNYTKKEKIIDAGPIHLSADKKEHVEWPPYAGGILVLVGAVIVLKAKN